MVENNKAEVNQTKLKVCVDQEFAASLKLKFDQALSLGRLDVQLKEEAAVLKPYRDLICVVCQNIVWKPKTCDVCERIYCSSCLDKWTQESNSCPNCRQSPFKNGKIPLIVKNMLSDLKLKCDNCSEVLPYETFYKHLAQCQFAVPCLLQCGDGQQYVTFDSMKQHLLDDCKNMQMKCEECSQKFVRGKNH